MTTIARNPHESNLSATSSRTWLSQELAVLAWERDHYLDLAQQAMEAYLSSSAAADAAMERLAQLEAQLSVLEPT